MNSDSRMLAYLSIMALIFSCVAFGYSLFFFGFGPQQQELSKFSALPGIIVAAGLVIAAMNAIATNVLSTQLEKKLETVSPTLRLGISIGAFFVTLALSIFIAFLSA